MRFSHIYYAELGFSIYRFSYLAELTAAHFGGGGGLLRKKAQNEKDDKPKSRQELIEELIAKSKQEKVTFAFPLLKLDSFEYENETGHVNSFASKHLFSLSKSTQEATLLLLSSQHAHHAEVGD